MQREIKEKIESYLRNMKIVLSEIEAINKEYEAETQKISERYGEKITSLKEAYGIMENDLLKLAKKEKAVIFDGSDIYETRYGRLIHEMAERVGIPKDALEKCEKLGFTEAIRISKSLDRTVVEKWPDERLFLIGAKRELKEKIIYELSNELS
jgi:hypothetical protein